jgi:hypothetical protein
MDLLASLLQVLLITFEYSAIADLHTYTGPLLVPQLKHRNYNSLTGLHTPSITHERSLLITHKVFTGRLLTPILQQTFRGYLPPRTQN